MLIGLRGAKGRGVSTDCGDLLIGLRGAKKRGGVVSASTDCGDLLIGLWGANRRGGVVSVCIPVAIPWKLLLG